MSILRYNNSGTWEAINIDHASTADSALYDDDGNIISSTYLPLSAGENKTLTGDLYLDIGSDNWRNIRIYNGSTPMVTFASAPNGNAYIGSCNSEGSMQSGMMTQVAGDVYIFSNSVGNIAFRPKGSGSTTNQIYINQDGQQIGGHPLTTLSGGTKTLTVNNYTTIGTMTGIPTGNYIVYAKSNFLPSNSNAGKYILQLGPTSEANWVWHTHDITPSSVGHSCLAYPMYISTGSLYFSIWSGIASTISSWEMGYQRY